MREAVILRHIRARVRRGSVTRKTKTYDSGVDEGEPVHGHGAHRGTRTHELVIDGFSLHALHAQEVSVQNGHGALPNHLCGHYVCGHDLGDWPLYHLRGHDGHFGGQCGCGHDLGDWLHHVRGHDGRQEEVLYLPTACAPSVQFPPGVLLPVIESVHHNILVSPQLLLVLALG